MATKPLPDQALLLKLLRYEPETGKLFWRERPADMCKDERGRLWWIARYANAEAFTSTVGGYKTGTIRPYGSFRAHRVIWCMVHGEWPEQIDHVNQDGTDNRLMNLRPASRCENARNARLGPRNHSGRIGVNWNRHIRKWRAKIRHDGRYIELGKFDNFEDACVAREAAEKRYGYSPLHGRAVK